MTIVTLLRLHHHMDLGSIIIITVQIVLIVNPKPSRSNSTFQVMIASWIH